MWSFEEEATGNENLPIKNLTLKVNEEIKDVVLMVNKHEGWELETSELNLLVNINTRKKHGFDVMWVKMKQTILMITYPYILWKGIFGK